MKLRSQTIKKIYLGAFETPFKERFGNHTTDFKHQMHENCTELLKYIWNLKFFFSFLDIFLTGHSLTLGRGGRRISR